MAPIGPAPITSTTSPGWISSGILPAQHARERLDHAGSGGIDALSQRDQVALEQGCCGEPHVLCECAVDRDADGLVVSTAGCCCR